MATRTRAKLDRVSVDADDIGPYAEVELRYGSLSFRGRSRSADGAPPAEHHLVAQATFAAVEQLVGRQVLFSLDSVGLQDVSESRVVLLTAHVDVQGAKDLRLGACLVADGDVRTAAARAALDSANRAISVYLPWVAGDAASESR